jgi:Tol biopolymer transport system component
VGKTDGTSLRSVWSLKEGANLAWFPDNRHLLLTARDAANQRFGLWVVDTSGQGAASLIVESKGLTVASFSAEGARVAYAVSGQGEANSGIWSALADGSNREKLSWLGSWRWSWLEPERLYYLPVGENALWSYDFTNGKATRMTDPATMPLKVAGNEWVLLPADKGLVYRNASDNSLWWLQLNR